MKVSIHTTLNSSRGVICCRDLAGMADIDIRDELSDQGARAVKRINITHKDKKRHRYFLSDILQQRSTKGYPHWIFASECRSLFSSHYCVASNAKSTNMEPRDAVRRCSSTAVCPKIAREHGGACIPPLPLCTLPHHPPKCVNSDGAHPSSS